MFSDSLLDSNRTRARRGWSTLLSFAIETIGITLLVLIPLLSGVALPTFKSTIIDVTPLGAPATSPKVIVSHPVHGLPVVTQEPTALRLPRAVPPGIKPDPEENNASVAPPVFSYGMPTGNPEILPIFDDENFVAPRPATPPATVPGKRLVISHMDPGTLVHQVQPPYPEAARITRTQGTVQIAAIIARDGTISKLHVLSGPPLLVVAAVDAVRQWRYRPYILNGQPVEVETQISVNFTLGQQ
jgi:protein TonB